LPDTVNNAENAPHGEPQAGASREEPMRQRAMHLAEQMMMTVQSGPPRDPFVEKMDGEHIHKVLDHSHSIEKKRLWMMLSMAVLAVIAVFSLCWLFLAYNKPEHINSIIALIVGALGGFGAGVGWQKSRSE
jgi:hypothetical protein